MSFMRCSAGCIAGGGAGSLVTGSRIRCCNLPNVALIPACVGMTRGGAIRVHLCASAVAIRGPHHEVVGGRAKRDHDGGLAATCRPLPLAAWIAAFAGMTEGLNDLSLDLRALRDLRL